MCVQPREWAGSLPFAMRLATAVFCVFCGSSDAARPGYLADAARLGKALAKAKIRLKDLEGVAVIRESRPLRTAAGSDYSAPDGPLDYVLDHFGSDPYRLRTWNRSGSDGTTSTFTSRGLR